MDNKDKVTELTLWPHKGTMIKNILIRLGAGVALLIIGFFLAKRLPSVAAGLIKGVSVGVFIYLLLEILMTLLRLPKVLALDFPSLVLSPESLSFLLPNPNLSLDISTTIYTVPWRNVKELALYKSGFVVLIGLDLREEDQIQPALTADDKSRLKSYNRLTGNDLVFSISDFAGKPEELLDLLKDYESLPKGEESL